MAVKGSGQKTRDKILKTARKQFYEQGYTDTTLATISTEADVNSAMVSYYFNGKLNLALEIYGTYMEDVKQLVRKTARAITPSEDLMLLTAIEVRVHTRNLQTSYKLARFMYELNQTCFFLSHEMITSDFFDTLARFYNLPVTVDEVKAVGISNYALTSALSAARYEGAVDWSNAEQSNMVFRHFAHTLSFDDAFIEKILSESLRIFQMMDIYTTACFKPMSRKSQQFSEDSGNV